ncbi:NYN domain-containing protein [Pseudomonas serbica]|uniref:NYN domain-containing protein n=1 Tax=Pseudomonas serbica TaxID=2965074 RepID=UPI00237A6F3C|nr:NYN domain-containing protein [Pseudomonas serbica]
MPDPVHPLNIALLIDADNTSSHWVEKIFSELSQIGTVSISQAYGNWSNPCMESWGRALQAHAIKPVHQPNLTKTKNAADMAMIVDAMDILFTKTSVDVFCIVSSDCDFTPLIMRLRAQCKQVVGFGKHGAAETFVNACTRFVYLDEPMPTIEPDQPPTELVATSLPQEVALAGSTRIPGNELQQDAKLMTLLRNTIGHFALHKGGWADLCNVGGALSKHPTFSHKDYGYKNLSQFLGAIDLFEIRKVSFQPTLVRARP